MQQLIELEYDDKTILVEVEVGKNEIEPIGREGQIGKVKGTVGAISDIVTVFAKEISRAVESARVDAAQLESMTLELGAKFTASGDVCVVKGSADASIKITVKWIYNEGQTKKKSQTA